MSTHYLDRLFSPGSIAVFGANERPDSVAGRVYDNLRQGGFGGALYAVNPKHRTVDGHAFRRRTFVRIERHGCGPSFPSDQGGS